VLDRELIGGEQGGGLGEAGVVDVDEVAGGGEDQRGIEVAVEEGEALLRTAGRAGSSWSAGWMKVMRKQAVAGQVGGLFLERRGLRSWRADRRMSTVSAVVPSSAPSVESVVSVARVVSLSVLVGPPVVGIDSLVALVDAAGSPVGHGGGAERWGRRGWSLPTGSPLMTQAGKEAVMVATSRRVVYGDHGWQHSERGGRMPGGRSGAQEGAEGGGGERVENEVEEPQGAGEGDDAEAADAGAGVGVPEVDPADQVGGGEAEPQGEVGEQGEA
jgi:hypothetical protein